MDLEEFLLALLNVLARVDEDELEDALAAGCPLAEALEEIDELHAWFTREVYGPENVRRVLEAANN